MGVKMSRLKTYLLLGLACLTGIAVAATNYTPVGTTYYTSVSLPSKGDALTADSVSTAIKRALDNTAYVKAQAEAGTYGSATSVPRVSRTALSLGALYEIRNYQGKNALALTRFETFSRVARSYTIAGASTQYGWTTDANFTSTTLSAANENTTTSGALRLGVKAVGTSYNVATRTAPTMYRAFTAGPDGAAFIQARFQINNQAFTNQLAGLVLVQDDDNTRMVGLWCGYLSGGHRCEGYDGTSATAATTAGTLTNGVWLQIEYRNNKTVNLWYSFTNQATPPTDWTRLKTKDDVFSSPEKVIRAGIVALGSASGTYTVDVPYLDTKFYQNPMLWGTKDLVDDWAAQGFDTSSTAIQLITDWDTGTQGSPSQAKLRQVLADAVNPFEGSSTTSTWTFSAVCSASLGAAAGTYYAAGSLVLTDTGKYCNLWAKATSDGYYPASLDVDSIYFPIVP